ncbi:hypothetical protein [Streptomyces bambusae]|uniref:Uncharacterized protein n=1 Tax=Streptomyces bambusae TaxID=1550616 RepID=A0ABS6Z4F0_9ACTN|nr:hypothetical protein [Streptomyces bambusae]MBW5481595.1 hypothetical protein [Streptomyces bambusae]
MDARENGLAFHHVEHRLRGRQVVDTRSLREGELMAVMAEAGGDLVAYIRGADHREFDAPLDCVRPAR